LGTFPIGIRPDAPWRHLANSRNAHFGAGRVGYPIHGACDLLAPANTEVYAVADGTIIRGPYEFLHIHDNQTGCDSTTYAIDVAHDGFIARYCEIARNLAPGLAARSTVTEGQVIAFIGTQCGGTMLHFEMFQDTTRLAETLTDRSGSTRYLYVPQADYQRRNDLLDPTPYLDAWWWDFKVKHHRQMDLSMEVYDPPAKPARRR
jgi:murein DD-endopeptidase MepM/ murein hydrolase activator NlpD